MNSFTNDSTLSFGFCRYQAHTVIHAKAKHSHISINTFKKVRNEEEREGGEREMRKEGRGAKSPVQGKRNALLLTL